MTRNQTLLRSLAGVRTSAEMADGPEAAGLGGTKDCHTQGSDPSVTEL